MVSKLFILFNIHKVYFFDTAIPALKNIVVINSIRKPYTKPKTKGQINSLPRAKAPMPKTNPNIPPKTNPFIAQDQRKELIPIVKPINPFCKTINIFVAKG